MTTTTRYRLEYDDVVRTLKELAAERPDFNYQETSEFKETGHACKYEHQGAPSCIVGHVIHRLVSLDAVLTMGQLERGEEESQTFWIPEDVADMDAHTSGLLFLVQRKQDAGIPWGEAVARALAGEEDDEHE